MVNLAYHVYYHVRKEALPCEYLNRDFLSIQMAVWGCQVWLFLVVFGYFLLLAVLFFVCLDGYVHGESFYVFVD